MNQFEKINYAKNSSYEPSLAMLATDENFEVRCNVATNQYTDLPTLKLLAQDETAAVRSCVISNPNLPINVLEVMAVSREDWNVSNLAKTQIAKRTTNPDILDQLAQDPEWEIVQEVARNKHISDKLFKQLANHQQWEVRYEIARSQRVTNAILKKLANDTNAAVQLAAESEVNSRLSVKMLTKVQPTAKQRSHKLRANAA